MDERKLTFQEMEEFSNKVGTYFLGKGFRSGDCVALFMETRPEYVGLWLGLSKIGIITALINSNQRRETLKHSIEAAKAKAIIVGTELAPILKDVWQNEDLKWLSIFQFSDEEQRDNDNFDLIKGKKEENFFLKRKFQNLKNLFSEAVDLTADLKQQIPQNLQVYIEQCKPKDTLLYVYTSGTTGLPKAAVITNLRSEMTFSPNLLNRFL